MKRIFLVIITLLISSLCLSNAHAGPLLQSRKAKAEATKEAREVDLPVMRDKARFLKQKLEELQSKGQKQVNITDTLTKSVYSVIAQMNEANFWSGLPTEINDEDYVVKGVTPKRMKEKGTLEIGQVIFKLEEIITTIDSIIGPEKSEKQEIKE